MKRLAMCLWLLSALPAGAEPPITPQAKAVAWPAGPGAELVRTRCMICHNGEMVATQRLTAGQWRKEVSKMAGWGAPLSADEQKVLAAYLAAHYGTQAPTAAPQRVHL